MASTLPPQTVYNPNLDLMHEIRLLEDLGPTYTGHMGSSVTDSYLGYGSYSNSVTPETSSLLPQDPLNSADMYGNHKSDYMQDYESSNHGNYSDTNTDYRINSMDMSNYGTDQNMFSLYGSGIESHTSCNIYDHPESYSTYENNQMWNIENSTLHNVELNHFDQKHDPNIEQNLLFACNSGTSVCDMLDIYDLDAEAQTTHFRYENPSDLSIYDNDQSLDKNYNLLENVELDIFIQDKDFSSLSSGLDQLQLDTSLGSIRQVRGKPRKKKQPKDVNVSQDAMDVICKKISGPGKRARYPKNWEFLMRLLANSETNPSVICWDDRENYIFRLVEPENIIQLWNTKQHKCSQSYDNFARGLRYHYQKDILQPVLERQLVYRCGPLAIQYFNSIISS